MSFAAKHDFFGLGSSAGLVLTETNEGVQASTAEGHNEKGDVVAFEVFGQSMSPECTYILSSNVNLASIKCGEPIAGTGDYSSHKYTLGSLTINTQAGSPPSIQASGEEIPSAITSSDCTYTFPSATLQACHHAQILWDAFTLSGTGCYLQSANYTAGGTISRGTKNGETISYDVTDGKLEVNINILQTGNTKPSVTAGSDWTITAPLNCSNPDSDYPSWTCTLSRYLTHDA